MTQAHHLQSDRCLTSSSGGWATLNWRIWRLQCVTTSKDAGGTSGTSGCITKLLSKLANSANMLRSRSYVLVNGHLITNPSPASWRIDIIATRFTKFSIRKLGTKESTKAALSSRMTTRAPSFPERNNWRDASFFDLLVDPRKRENSTLSQSK